MDEGITSIERKLRMPQVQGVRGRSRSKLLRALGNAGDGVPSAFLKGKQNEKSSSHFISRLQAGACQQV